MERRYYSFEETQLELDVDAGQLQRLAVAGELQPHGDVYEFKVDDVEGLAADPAERRAALRRSAEWTAHTFDPPTAWAEPSGAMAAVERAAASLAEGFATPSSRPMKAVIDGRIDGAGLLSARMRATGITQHLLGARRCLDDNPWGCLNGCRSALESMLIGLLEQREIEVPEKPEASWMIRRLKKEQVLREQRILALCNVVNVLGNIGSHSNPNLTHREAQICMLALVSLLEWYVMETASW